MECDACADVYVGVDLAQVAYIDIVGNVGFFADDAVSTDAGAVANVHAIPDASPIAYVDVMFDDGSGVDSDGFVHG